MSSYVPPVMAYRQLKNAYELRNSVYIYGATGYGKTRLVQEFFNGKNVLWLSGKDSTWDIDKLNGHECETQENCIVIDDTHAISSKEQRDLITKCVKDSGSFVVIIGRTRSPQWLIPLIAEGLIGVISEKQLRMSADDIIKMAKQYDVLLTSEEAVYLEKESDGNAYAISIAIQLMKNTGGKLASLTENVNELFVNHLEQEVISQWDVYLQEFMMMISVVDEFSLPMAVMITGDDQAAKLIDEASGLGNFMSVDGGIYRFRPQLLVALRNKALKVFGLSEYRRFIANAAHYFEMQDDILMALKLYEQAEKRENIRALLIRHSRRHPGSGYYYELRKYYFELTDEDIEDNPILMSAMSLLYSILLNPEKSEYWYDKLEKYSHSVRAGEKRETDELLLYLDLALPHRGSKGVQNTFKHAFTLFTGGKIKLPELSITNNGPSAMNGGKDFCEWSKKDKLLADTIGKMIETLTGEMGRGLVHAAMCESIFEKGKNDAEATHHAMLVNLDIEGGGKHEILFISVAIQARAAIIKGDMDSALRVIDAYEEHISDYDNDALKRNLESFRCRLALTTGKMDFVAKWLETAPDEVIDFCTLERYSYMTKALCYIQLGMNTEATDLLAKLRYYSSEYQRTYIHMETGLLIAIISRRNGGDWKEIFLSTLLEIQEYQFIRTISEKGAGILPLLKEIKKDYLSLKVADANWFSLVMKETESLAKKYPGYLTCSLPQPSDFSEIDVDILKMQAEGLTTKEIAAKIYMSERTVKYHVSENYKKLGANGKVEAIQIAQNINLI